MTALPFAALILLNIAIGLLGYLSQRSWFLASRRWWLRRGWPPRLHFAWFFLGSLGCVWVLADHAYHRPAWASALYGWSSVYLIASSISGLMLYVPRAGAWLLRFAGSRLAGKPTPEWTTVGAPRGSAVELRETSHPAHEPPLSARRQRQARPLSRRALMRWTGGAILAAPWAACAYGYAIERTDVQLTHVPLRLGAIARPLRGLSFVQISDIHLDDYFSTRRLEQMVARINRLRPDLVLITGDFITYRHSISDVMRALAALRACYGIYGCLGNHEPMEHAQRAVAAACASIGITILRFQARKLRLPSGRLNLIGVDFLDDAAVGDVQAVRSLVRAGELNILLSHNPNVFPHLGNMPIQLTLAGHLHGGQIVLPGLHELSPARLVSPYLAGLFHQDGHWMYVNRGLGTVGVPIRFGARPEITLFKL